MDQEQQMTQNVVQFAEKSDIGAISRTISECETSYDVLRFTRDFAKSYGFDYFSIIRLPTDREKHLSTLAIITNWPPDLVNTYDQLGLLENSPVIDALRKSTKPLIWKLDGVNRADPEGRGAAAISLFSTFDMNIGIYFPTLSPSGERGVVSFSGAREAPTDSELLELAYYSNLIYERATSLRAAPCAMEQPLSGRERECLEWTASGKTSVEIALILGLSEHTVNHYLSAACQKLGAANRAHAVAKAIRSGLLD